MIFITTVLSPGLKKWDLLVLRLTVIFRFINDFRWNIKLSCLLCYVFTKQQQDGVYRKGKSIFFLSNFIHRRMHKGRFHACYTNIKKRSTHPAEPSWDETCRESMHVLFLVEGKVCVSSRWVQFLVNVNACVCVFVCAKLLLPLSATARAAG